MGIMPVSLRKSLNKLGTTCYIKPYLLRGLDINRRNQVWCIDITYIPMKKGCMYLAAIIDVYSRFIVGWCLHNSLDAFHCIEVLKNAIATYGAPETINSDQGNQFTYKSWLEACVQHPQMKVSMDGRGQKIISGLKDFGKQ